MIECLQFRDRLGDEILVLHRNDRVRDAHHRADFIAAISARIDHDVTVNIALGCLDGPAIVRALLDARHRGMSINFGPGLSRPPCKCLT